MISFPQCLLYLDTAVAFLTIAPHTQIQLAIDFSLPPSIPENLIHSILPIFTVDTAQGEQMLALSQLKDTLAFANDKQFSCYALQGTTFVLELRASMGWYR